MKSVSFPSIVILVEHWLRCDEPMVVPGYVQMSRFSRTQFTHGGTLIMMEKEFLTRFKFVSIDRFDHLLVEKVFEFSMVFCRKLKMYVLGIYRSPSANFDLFLEKLESLLNDIPVNAMLILSGDLNVNFLDKCNRSNQILSNLLKSFNFKMHVDQPTRFSALSSSLLDYFCTNFRQNDIQCATINAGLSDHEAVLGLVPYNISSNENTVRRGRLYTRSNYCKFSLLCRQHDWNHVLVGDDTLHEFHQVLMKIFNIAFPIVIIKKRNRKPWYTKGLLSSGKNMRSLHYIRKYSMNNPAFLIYYNRYRRIYRNSIKLAKWTYYQDRMNNSFNRSRESWNIVNDLRGRNNVSVTPSNLDPNDLNSFYCNIATELSARVSQRGDPSTYLNHLAVSESFFFAPTNAEELKHLFRAIKNKGASGWDGISLKIFLALPDVALQALAEAISISFVSGVFPSCLKRAVIIPLFKGGEPDDPSHFRPLALLPTLAKVVERLVKVRVTSFLDRLGLLSSQQFGFRETMGTSDAIFSFLDHLYNLLNGGEAASAVFCDLSKAFDCVNHEVLLMKLERYGFRGPALEWFRSYLSGRVQAVKFNDDVSEELDIGVGVPQGTVLGPPLFLIYVNDLPRLRISGKFTVFADDTTILWHGSNVSEMEANMRADLGKIKDWCDANFLSFNVSKTNILNFKCVTENIYLDNKPITVPTFNKFLGLSIDRSLRFDIHIANVRNKISSGCYALRVISVSLDFSTAKCAYYAIIESHLRYGICFWGSCSDNLFNSVFLLQKRAIRYLCGAKPRESCRPLFLSHGILTLCCLFVLETVCLVFRKYKLELELMGRYSTRQDRLLRLPIPRTELIRGSIIYGGKKLFNRLPLELRMLNSEKRLRKEAKKFLAGKAYYSLSEFYNDAT